MSHPAKKPSRSKFSLSLAALFFSLPHQSSPAPSITLIFRSRVDLLFQRVDEEMRVVLFLIVSPFSVRAKFGEREQEWLIIKKKKNEVEVFFSLSLFAFNF